MSRIERNRLIEASPDEIYAALCDPAAIARWWTSDVRGGAELGDLLELGFYDRTIVTRFRVEVLEPGRLVEWRGEAGPVEYIGSTLRFELEPMASGTRLLIRHEGLGGDDDFAAHAARSWERVLESIRSLLEESRGSPISI